MNETTASTVLNPNPSFNDDIMFDILSRLPVKVLQQFKLVSKHWKSMISDPVFVNLHFSLSKTRSDGTTLLIHPSFIPEEDKEKPILFSLTDLFNGGNPIPLKNLDLGNPIPLNNLDLGRRRSQLSMLKPVNGLVCFVGGDSVLIYNPFTGEKTSWIEALAVDENLLVDEDPKMERHNTFSFGFGFDPIIKKHKVVCICEIFRMLREKSFQKPELVHQSCDVLIVGENTWRKIDEVPPPNNPNVTGETLHVNGSIYWVTKNYPRPKVLLAFDLRDEKFRVIGTPGNYCERVSQPLHLVEVDGCIGLLDSYFRDIYLLRFEEDSGNWIDEEIKPAPFPWDGKPPLLFQALPGTDLLILKSCYQRFKSLWYYDRKNKSSNNVQITWDSSSPVSRFVNKITLFVESLFTVQN